MQNSDFASHVHAIVGRGLELYERLDHADRSNDLESLDFETEHGQLLTLLWPEGGLAANPDFIGEDDFFGAQYALACWLDEIFIFHSAWGDIWTNVSLENELKGDGQQRGWRFWEQAVKAASQPRAAKDALEVYLWCFALGFRGKPEPNVVKDPFAWAEKTRNQLAKTLARQEFEGASGSRVRREKKRLMGRRAFNRMTTLLTVCVIFAAIAAMIRVMQLP